MVQAISDQGATNKAATECCGAGEGTAVSLSKRRFGKLSGLGRLNPVFL